MKIGAPTLDQLEIFLTVAEAGGLAVAGRKLKRATSAIAYGIENLERQLGLALFEREGTRKPVLTEAGRALVVHARTVLGDVDLLRAKAASLIEGLEAEVSLAVDVLFPTARLVDALQGFRSAFPEVGLRLHAEALGGVIRLVADGRAGIGITSPIHPLGDGMERQMIGHVPLTPVASPLHPLARSGQTRPGVARNHVQLVLTDRSGATDDEDFGVIGTSTWRLADLGVKHALLLAGLGWGSMPVFMVQDDLEAGKLIALDLPDWREALYPLQLIWRTKAPPGPATRWLIDRFAAQSA